MTYTIDESLSDTEFTLAHLVDDVFGVTRRYESITIHHWGVFGQTHDGVNKFFVNGNPNTSAHFVVSDGRINCLVSPVNAAWAAGNAYGNATSIHIEARPEASHGDYRTVSWLVSWLRSVYGENLPLKAHREWSPTACPGIWDLARVDREARMWTRSTAKPTTPKPPAKAVRTPGPGQFRVDAGDTLSGIAAQFGETLAGLIAANPGINPNKIYVGQILNHSRPKPKAAPKAAPKAKPKVAPKAKPKPALPPYCTVDPGDTLGGIAVQYGVTLQYILKKNPGINADLIVPGQRINL